MPYKEDQNGRLTKCAQDNVHPGPDGPVAPAAGTQDERQSGKNSQSISAFRRKRTRMILRLILIGLSAGGMVAAASLWLSGHGWLGARVLAGDILAIIVIVLLSS